MAKVANAYTTYQAGGNREDLADRIYNIDPFDTPGVSMIGRRNVKNRTFDWQICRLGALQHLAHHSSRLPIKPLNVWPVRE